MYMNITHTRYNVDKGWGSISVQLDKHWLVVTAYSDRKK